MEAFGVPDLFAKWRAEAIIKRLEADLGHVLGERDLLVSENKALSKILDEEITSWIDAFKQELQRGREKRGLTPGGLHPHRAIVSPHDTAHVAHRNPWTANQTHKRVSKGRAAAHQERKDRQHRKNEALRKRLQTLRDRHRHRHRRSHRR
jgi:hypothetical protein